MKRQTELNKLEHNIAAHITIRDEFAHIANMMRNNRFMRILNVQYYVLGLCILFYRMNAMKCVVGIYFFAFYLSLV